MNDVKAVIAYDGTNFRVIKSNRESELFSRKLIKY